MTGLTKDDALALAVYVGNQTHPCKLTELHANANHMGYSGVRAVITAIQRCWTMEKVELYSNEVDGTTSGEEDDENTEGDDMDEMLSAQEAIMSYTGGSGCGWGRLHHSLKLILSRNMFLKQNTTKEALLLLKYSRLMLQKKRKPAQPPLTAPCEDCDCSPLPQQQRQTTDVPDVPTHSSFSFTYLPTEIQLHILSALAPTLSSAQRIRIFEYAVDSSTLPSLRLCLPSSSMGCVPDPGNLGFNSAANGLRNRAGKKVGSLTRLREVHSCPAATCMAGQSIVCQRQTMREKWLASVGCDEFDPGVH
ncbi:hypothetical protein BJ912DRAFT_994148 [Pholiota molesta]|nr:hypothetical protein BJ912DRAFT_994148 [Pholiota molesta]